MHFSDELADGSSMELTSAILIYSGPKQEYGGTPCSMAVCHTVRHGETGATLGPGKLATTAGIRALTESLSRDKASGQWLPANVVAHGQQMLAWWQPSCLRRIWFGEDSADHLNGRLCRWPAMLFAVEQRRLYVRALASDARPEPRTPLFVAPFPNVHDNGSVALCGVRCPGGVSVADMTHWERCFYDSRFTHGRGEGTAKGKIDEMWLAITADPPPAAFPVSLLKPAETLEAFLK